MATELVVAGQHLPLANGLCRECLESKLPKGANPRSIIIYCEHNQAGAVMHSRNGCFTGIWLVITPVSAGQWTDWMVNDRMPRLQEYQ
jgi:hypothetical protein